MATFPIGARDDSITVPGGNDFNPVSMTACRVIFLTLSLIIIVSSDNSAGVIQLISPFQYLEQLVFGVVPDTISHISPNLNLLNTLSPQIRIYHSDFPPFYSSSKAFNSSKFLSISLFNATISTSIS